MGLIDKILIGEKSSFEYSEHISKDYNDLLRFLKTYKPKGNFKPALAEVYSDTDDGYRHEIRGRSGGTTSELNFEITHKGNVATRLLVQVYIEKSKKFVMELFDELKKTVKDSNIVVTEAPKATAPLPTEDYSQYSLRELVDVMSAKATELGSNPDAAHFAVFKAAKDVFCAKVNQLPLSESGKFAPAISNIDLYITTLTTQFSNPMSASMVGQFIGTYVGQIQGSLAQIATLLD